MTGIAAIASRIDSIENRLEDFRTSTAEFGGTSGRAAVSADAMDANRSGAVFSGVLGSMTMGGTQTAGLFGYVPVGTKLATVPGTQAYEAAQLAAREAAAAEAAARQVAASMRAQEAAAARAARAGGSGGAGAGGAGAVTAASSATGTSGAGAASGASAVAPVPAAKGGLTGDGVVATAKKYLGVPYKWGGQTTAGMDCSGLVQRTFLDHGIKLPRTAKGLMKAGTEVPSLAQAQPGDLIITRGGGHVAIYLGDNKIIHAPYAGEVVKIQKNYSTDRTIDTIRRIVPAGGGA